MTAVATAGELTRAQRRRRLSLGLFRAAVSAAGLTALYYLVPLDRLARQPLWVTLLMGFVILGGLSWFEVRGVVRSRHPALRAIIALAVILPIFLLLFAAEYFILAVADPAAFSDAVTRTDSLYFTITIFSTVGFGDITAVSEPARILVTCQMILDLVVLGLGIRVLTGAVDRGRQHQSSPPDEG